MKLSKYLLICATSVFAGYASFGGGDQCHPSGTKTKAEGASMEQQQKSFRVSELLGKSAQGTQGQELGKLTDVSITQDGQIFAMIDVGNERYAAVPWQLLDLSGKARDQQNLTFSITKDKLDSAPSLSKNDFDNLNKSEFTQQIYSHFGTQPPTALGGTDSGSERIEGSDQEQQDQKDQPDVLIPNEQDMDQNR